MPSLSHFERTTILFRVSFPPFTLRLFFNRCAFGQVSSGRFRMIDILGWNFKELAVFFFW